MADNSEQHGVVQMAQQVNALYNVLEKLWGKQKLKRKADELRLSDKINSDGIKDKIEVLHGLLFYDNTGRDLSSR